MHSSSPCTSVYPSPAPLKKGDLDLAISCDLRTVARYVEASLYAHYYCSVGIVKMSPNAPLQQEPLPCYTRRDVSNHKNLDDCWIIVDGEVYNVTSWLRRHPGGARILMHYAGEDATVSLQALLL